MPLQEEERKSNIKFNIEHTKVKLFVRDAYA